MNQQKVYGGITREGNIKEYIISGIPNDELNISKDVTITDEKGKIDAIFGHIRGGGGGGGAENRTIVQIVIPT